MPEDNSAKKDAAKQEKSVRPYTGPGTAELEQKITGALPRTRIYFAFDSGEATADDERMTQQFRQSAQTEILRHLDNYSRATIADGTFAEKWPAMLADVSRYDTLAAYSAANAVLQENFADASVLGGKPELMNVAKRAFLDMGLRYTMENLSISDAEYEKRRALDPEYNQQAFENQFVNLLENHFYLARKAGTFATEWPAKIEQASKFAPDLAVRGAARFFERVAVEEIDGRPQPVKLNASDFTIACKTAAAACARAADAGDALLASDTMNKVLFRIVQAGKTGALEQKDFFALAGEIQAEQEKFMLRSFDQLADTITKQSVEGGNPVIAGRARNDLTRALSQYFYVAEGKGALATEWSAVMDKIAAVDPGVAAAAANLYFSQPAKPVSLPDFMTACAKTKELCEKAAARGQNAMAAETLANVLFQLRAAAQNEAIPQAMREDLTKLGISVGAAEEAVISAGIAEAVKDVTMPDAELARRALIDPSFSDQASEDRLLFLLDEYLYENIIKGTVSKDWPVKLQEVAAADPEIAARAAQIFFVAPRTMISDLNEFKSVCATAAQTAMAAHEKGFNLSAAETLAAMVRSTKRNIEAIEKDEALQKSLPEILPALHEIESDVGEKLETVMHSWEEAVAKKPDDPRDAEQIERAQSTYQAFLKTLAPALPVPAPSAPQPPAPQAP